MSRADSPTAGSRDTAASMVRTASHPPVIRYVDDARGARIAWAAAGNGQPALLAIAGWLSHLHLDWTDAEIGSFYRTVALRRRLIRYDQPGLGLADRIVSDYTLSGAVDHARRVLFACGEERVALLGRTFSGPVAIALARALPERVSHLILFGTAPRIVAGPGNPEGVPLRLADAVERLVLAEWGLASQTITSLMLPEVAPPVAARYAEYQRSCASPEVAAAMISALVHMDVTDLLPTLRVPTLVLHRRDDRIVNLAGGRLLAERIPGARLVVLEGSENVPYFGASEAIVAEINAFLSPSTTQLSDREVEVVRALAAGLTNQAIAEVLGISVATVARHLANIFIKLDVGNRTAAVAAARRAGALPTLSQ